MVFQEQGSCCDIMLEISSGLLRIKICLIPNFLDKKKCSIPNHNCGPFQAPRNLEITGIAAVSGATQNLSSAATTPQLQ
jgi:hypothetical protein